MHVPIKYSLGTQWAQKNKQTQQRTPKKTPQNHKPNKSKKKTNRKNHHYFCTKEIAPKDGARSLNFNRNFYTYMLIMKINCYLVRYPISFAFLALGSLEVCKFYATIGCEDFSSFWKDSSSSLSFLTKYLTAQRDTAK